jgi:hypothetical protein
MQRAAGMDGKRICTVRIGHVCTSACTHMVKVDKSARPVHVLRNVLVQRTP